MIVLQAPAPQIPLPLHLTLFHLTIMERKLHLAILLNFTVFAAASKYLPVILSLDYSKQNIPSDMMKFKKEIPNIIRRANKEYNWDGLTPSNQYVTRLQRKMNGLVYVKMTGERMQEKRQHEYGIGGIM